jgi:hypothetical protein
MSLRAAAAAVAALTVLAPAAHGAGRPLCRLVADATGDIDGKVRTDHRELDILSGDVASDASTVTTVIRLRRTPRPGPTSPSVSYEFTWRYGDYDVTTVVATAPTGTSYDVVWSVPGSRRRTGFNSALIGVFDTERNEVRLTFELAALRAAVPDGGTEFSGFTLRAQEFTGLLVPLPKGGMFGAGHDADTATTQRTYRLGTRTCVRAG